MDSEIEAQLACLRQGLPVKEAIVVELCAKVSELLVNEPNVLSLATPAILIGDVHGQFHDLMRMFDMIQSKDFDESHRYCFAGDYVDRGHHSIETILYL